MNDLARPVLVVLSWGVDRYFCDRPIGQRETEVLVRECWGGCSRMRVARLFQESRTVHDEASRKTWQMDVNNGVKLTVNGK